MKPSLVKTSRFLSLVLRHKPQRIGLELDSEGWARIDDLLRLAGESGKRLSREELEIVVRDNDKKRFAISNDGTRIRARQGHSIQVDLGLVPSSPPATLYHGTVDRFMDSIRAEGLQPKGRQHVHLSATQDVAESVGARRGTPVILEVDAESMCAAGRHFFLSENSVWLTDAVPAGFIRFPEIPLE